MQIEANWVHCVPRGTGLWCLFYKHRSPWEVTTNLCGSLAAKPENPWPLLWAALGHLWWCNFGVLLTVSISWQISQPHCTGQFRAQTGWHCGVVFYFPSPTALCWSHMSIAYTSGELQVWAALMVQQVVCTWCNRKRAGGTGLLMGLQNKDKTVASWTQKHVRAF